MNYRPARGWALSFPVHAVAPSFPPCPHPTLAHRRPASPLLSPLVSAEPAVSNASPSPRPHQPRLASPRLASPRLAATIAPPSPLALSLSLSVIPFSFSISSGKIPPSPMFLFFSLFYRLGRFSLNVQTTSLGPGFYLLTLLRRSDNFQRIEDLI